MSATQNNHLHNKFFSYWKDYERRDITKVCNAICKLMNLSRHNSNSYQAVKDNWARVCTFLVEWHGRKRI